MKYLEQVMELSKETSLIAYTKREEIGRIPMLDDYKDFYSTLRVDLCDDKFIVLVHDLLPKKAQISPKVDRYYNMNVAQALQLVRYIIDAAKQALKLKTDEAVLLLAADKSKEGKGR